VVGDGRSRGEAKRRSHVVEEGQAAWLWVQVNEREISSPVMQHQAFLVVEKACFEEVVGLEEAVDL